MKRLTSSPVLDALIKAGKLTEEQAGRALAEKQDTGLPVEQVLVKAGTVTTAAIVQALERYFNVSFIDLEKHKIDTELFKILPEEIMRRYTAIPVRKDGSDLHVALSYPNNIIALDDIGIITGYAVKPFAAFESGINNIINSYYAPDEIGKALKQLVSDSLSAAKIKDESAAADIKEAAGTAPVVKLVDTILTDAVALGASDIHIEPQEKGVFVRYRVNGILASKEFIPKEIQLAVTSRIKIMADMNITERRLPQDGQMRMQAHKRDIDFRVSTLPAKYGEKIVIRVLDKSNFALGIEHLGFQSDTQTKFEELLNAGSGMILVTGPTGSGKTTTLYSALNRIRSSTRNIITLEDPIEYDLLSGKAREGGITQVQINAKIGLTFAQALRACLRQDPDIILLGEVRDEETCRIATNAALMGHLVLSTIHTNDSVSTVTRLLDMGIEPYLIASTLMGVVSQRLVRALCRHCREPYHPPKKILESLNVRHLLSENEDVTFYRPKGCERCDRSGYSGRVGIHELLLINETMRDLILEKAKLSVMRDTAVKSGMVTMKQNGIRLVTQGITTMAEVLRVIPTY